jgi:segregation and condensation protein A
MDLLLYLIRKEEVDIYDIPISRITEQYLKYIEMLKSLDIDLAGSFLVMAATLMQIKSAMLLPAAEPERLEGEDLSDPRTQLIRQLLEYKKFKDAANLLDNAAQISQTRFHRPSTIIENLKPNAEPEIDIEQVSVWDLLEAFDAICKATGTNFQIKNITDETPIDLYQIEILTRLQSEGPASFEKIFESRPNRLVIVGLFLALLELIRDGLICAEPAGSSFILKALTDEPAELAVQKTIAAALAEGVTPDAERIEDRGQKTDDRTSARVTKPIPVVEIPPDKKKAASDYQKVGPPGSNKRQNAN